MPVGVEVLRELVRQPALLKTDHEDVEGDPDGRGVGRQRQAGEDQRLATAVVSALQRDVLKMPFLKAWLGRIAEPAGAFWRMIPRRSRKPTCSNGLSVMNSSLGCFGEL